MKYSIVFFMIALLTAGPVYGQYCDPPGELVGTTDYYSQGYGSSAQRIALDGPGGIHIAWTGSPSYPNFRNIFYNFRSESGGWLVPGSGVQIDPVNGAGFAALALKSGGEAVVSYHNINHNYSGLSVDAIRGFGIFTYYDVPDVLPSGRSGFWPQVAVSTNGDIHVLMTEHNMGANAYQLLAYTRSEDGGSTWLNPIVVDSVATQVSRIIASPTGEVTIAFLQPTDRSAFYSVKNDLVYVESTDGRTWDFANPINITNYLNDPDDIFCPWGQDAVYDPNGNLHFTWIINNIGLDGNFIDDATGLCYYNNITGVIDVIADFPDADLVCDPGPMNSAISMPNISIRGGGDIAIAYTGFVDSDVSGEDFCVGDLYLALGNANQGVWQNIGNITETHSPNCMTDCLSEEFPSLTETMSDSTHLTYVMRNRGDDPDTVYYIPIEVPIISGIEDDLNLPGVFALLGNYPNPFNTQTTIEFTLPEPGDIELVIYDITGAKVESIRRAGLESGKHSILWDAGDVASGVYFARLESGENSRNIKMVLLK